MTWELGRALAFLLVFLRMTGLLVFNPIFGRSNVPVAVNLGLSFVTAVLLAGTVEMLSPPDPNLFELALLVGRELGVGMVAGFILRLFLSVLIIGGEVVDTQLGIGMSKVFDPASNASISLSASLYNVMFIAIFFLTNNHLTLLGLAARTFQVIPLGGGFQLDGLIFLPELFSSILVYAVKLCLPIVVIEVVVTMAVGIIMRIIPQINVFVVNIQFKLLVGMFALVVLVGPMMGYFETLIELCFDNIREVWLLMA